MRSRFVLACVAAAMSVVVFLPSCSDDPVSPGGGSSGPSWVAVRNPRPLNQITYAMLALWGSSSKDVYAVGRWVSHPDAGSKGAILHFDGQEWTFIRYGEDPCLTDVWGSSSTDVYAVGEAGTILHYDGRRWNRMTSGTTATLTAVWGRASNDVYAVGEAGTVLHYNGSEWRSIDSGTDCALNGVSGEGYWAFAVGDAGTVLRLTPRQAQSVDVPTSHALRAIGGSSATELYAVGNTGVVLRFDGSVWQPVRSWTNAALVAACGTRDGHSLVASGTAVFESDGGQWRLMKEDYDSFDPIRDVWGLSMRSVFLLKGQRILRYDGSSWSEMKMELPDLRGDEPGPSLMDMWGSSASNVFAVGAGGAVLHFNGVDWTSATAGAWGWTLESVWGVSEDEIYTVGNAASEPDPEECPPLCDGLVLSSLFLSSGLSWSNAALLEDRWIRALWGAEKHSVFGVASFDKYVVTEISPGLWIGGWEFYRAVLHYDGAVWSPMIEETTAGRLYDVWGSSESDVFAVGEGGDVLHYDGAVWTETASGTTETLHAVWGASAKDVFAVGENGTVVHFDGTAWATMASGTTQTLHDVWGSAANDVFAVGKGGTILHFDGSVWEAIPSPTENVLLAVWGSASDDVFAVGDYGTICHYGSH